MAIDPSTAHGAHALERLTAEHIAWLTTVTPDGQPQSMPVWFLWTDGELLVYSHRTARRNRNIRANPRVSFHLRDDGQGDDIVTIECEARIDEATPPAGENPAYLAKYASWLERFGWTTEYFDAEYPVPVRLRPVRLVAF